MNTWLVIHAAVTWCLVGLIWTVQVVHYPLLKNVGPDRFAAYHKRHIELIRWVVGPLMLAEVGSAGWLLLLGGLSWLFGISLVALALIWISTACVQIPLHQKLTQGHDPVIIDRLVSTNGWRTLAWTVRGLCLAMLLIQKTH
jgi:hypothetical protein